MKDSSEMWAELVAASALAQYMEFRSETVRTLAAKSIVVDPKTGRHKAVAPAVVGHLRSGRRKCCTLRTAKAIEKALAVPPGILFTPRLAHSSVAA